MLSRRSLLLLVTTIVAAFGAAWMEAPAWLVFVLATVTMFPLGTALARASEDLAHHLGPGLGSLVNATLGNAPELVILYLTLQKGHTEVVKATISGSLLCNLLLVIGLAALVGGIRYPFVRLNAMGTAFNVGTLSLVVSALLLPGVFARVPHPAGASGLATRIEDLSVWAAVTLLAVYFLNLLFTLVTHRQHLNEGAEEEPQHAPVSMGKALAWIVGCIVVVLFISEVLVDAADDLLTIYKLSPYFMGVVGLAMVGNAADYAVAVQMAWRNKVDLAFRIGTGAAIQVALFVAPVLVLSSRLTRYPLDLNFSPLEILSVALAVSLISVHSRDNAFTWFEGVQLIALYVIIAMAFFFY